MTLRFKANCAVMASSLFWGVTFVVVKNTLDDISVFAYLAARFTLGALPMAWIYRSDLRKVSRKELWGGLQVGAIMFGGYAFQTVGIAGTTPSKAAFITGISVVLVPVFLAVVWRRKISMWAWGGVISSFAGLYFLHGSTRGNSQPQPRRHTGHGLRGSLRVSNHFYFALQRRVFPGIVEFPAGRRDGGAVPGRGTCSFRDRLGAAAFPIDTTNGLRSSGYSHFHDRDCLSIAGLGTAPYYGHKHCANPCDGAGLCGDHVILRRSRTARRGGRSSARDLYWRGFWSRN